MTALLQYFPPITLEEMSGIRLMNRTDTKFVTSVSVLHELLKLATSDYRIQEIVNERLSPYYTVYFDTPQFDMYLRHETGHANRQKLRIRSYVSSCLNFLEVKTKNNHGRTYKKRISIEGFDSLHPNHNITFPDDRSTYGVFLHNNLKYDASILRECLENRFNRITLVNNKKTERLTIDTSLQFHNLLTDIKISLPSIAIIELKRDGMAPSPILNLLRRLRVKPMGFSKYCLGSAMTNPNLPHGRVKQRLHAIERIEHS